MNKKSLKKIATFFRCPSVFVWNWPSRYRKYQFITEWKMNGEIEVSINYSACIIKSIVLFILAEWKTKITVSSSPYKNVYAQDELPRWSFIKKRFFSGDLSVINYFLIAVIIRSGFFFFSLSLFYSTPFVYIMEFRLSQKEMFLNWNCSLNLQWSSIRNR